MFRTTGPELEVFLVHPGGPYFAKKDLGSWSVPKGMIEEGEDELEAAQREFQEETGLQSCGPFIALGEVRQRSDKYVVCWAFLAPAGLEIIAVHSNTYTLEWPRGSGKLKEFPEIDRGEFFRVPDARLKLLPAQAPFLDRLVQVLKSR
jgi:predicted NUDIX family NTP pyrophosphohydrolase